MDRLLKQSICRILGRTLLEFNIGLGERSRILVVSSHQSQFINCSNLTPSIASNFFFFAATSQPNCSNQLYTYAVSTFSVPIKYGDSLISHSTWKQIWLESFNTSIPQNSLNYFLFLFHI